MKKVIKVLAAKYETEMKAAETNLELLLANPVGIGEHSDFVGEADKLVCQITEARDKLETVEKMLKEE